MLLEFAVTNFMSIRERQVLSMLADEDDKKSLPDNVIEHAGFRVLKSVGIWGANASGKSNMLKAMATLDYLLRHGWKRNPGSSIPEYQPFRLAKGELNEPTTYETTFNAEGAVYWYLLSVTAKNVVEEKLEVFDTSCDSFELVFRRTSLAGSKSRMQLDAPRLLSTDAEFLQSRTNANVPLLCKAANENVDGLIDVFTGITGLFVTLTHLAPPHEILSLALKRLDHDGVPYSIQDLVNFARWADTGIEAIQPLKSKRRGIKMATASEPDAYSIEDVDVHDAVFLHRGAEGDYALSSQDESAGTLRMVGTAAPLLCALRRGQVLIVDELDASLHPDLVEAIVKLFHEGNTSADKPAQLIYTTHCTSIMRPEVLRRDQIVFAEKDVNGQSEYFALSEFRAESDKPNKKPRANEQFERRYLAGTYGAKPYLSGPLSYAPLAASLVETGNGD